MFHCRQSASDHKKALAKAEKIQREGVQQSRTAGRVQKEGEREVRG